MAIDVVCPSGHTFRVKSRYAGRSGRCPQCGETVVVPYQETVAWQPAADEMQTPLSLTAESDSPSNLRAGKTLGRFELQAVLGQGAFGTVYQAHDPQLDRQVALKVPRAGQLEDFTEIDRFLREARAAGQLRHPHIVPVYDAGKIDDTYYIAAGFVSGCTLQAALKKRGRFPPREAAALVGKLAGAMHYAHTQGIIHRDIKPANIMIDSKGEPHVMDFGLARRLNGEALRTMDGARMGTPAYMSPEQAAGHSHLADERSDLWALGVVLYELLTGRRPFDGNEVDVLVALRTEDLAVSGRMHSSAPKELETICLKCLARDPQSRYPSCRHLADELTRFLEGEPIVARRTPVWERAARWVRRNRTVSALGSLVVLVSLTFAIVSSLMVARLSRKERDLDLALQHSNSATQQANAALEQTKKESAARLRAEQDALAAALEREQALRDQQQAVAALDSAEEALGTSEEARQGAEKKAELADAARADAEQQARQAADAQTELEEQKRRLLGVRELAAEEGTWGDYIQQLAVAHSEIEQGNLDEARLSLEACDLEKRSWEWNHLMRCARQLNPSYEIPLLNVQDRCFVEDLDFDEQGRHVALLATFQNTPKTGTSYVAVYDTSTASWTLPWTATKYARAVRLSSDGRQLVVLGKQLGWLLLDVETGKQLSRVSASTWYCQKVYGRLHLMCYAKNNTIRLQDLSQPGKWLTIKRPGSPTHFYLLLPDQASYLCSITSPKYSDRMLQCCDSATGEVLEEFPKIPVSAAVIAKSWVGLSPDGSRLAVSNGDGKISLWDFKAGHRVTEPADWLQACQGDWCVSSDGRRSVNRFGIFERATGRNLASLRIPQDNSPVNPRDSISITKTAFSPAGRWLALVVHHNKSSKLFFLNGGPLDDE